VLDAQQMVESLVRSKPVGMAEAADSGHHRDHEGYKGLSQQDGVGAVVGEGVRVRLFDTTLYHMTCSQTMLYPTSDFGFNCFTSIELTHA
jgi:hypothetical protein